MDRGKAQGRRDKDRDRQRTPPRSYEQELIYPTADEVLTLYGELMGAPGEDPEYGVRDRPLLESALARPRHAALYDQASLSHQAATLLWGLIKNHPFIDGNKRISHLVMATFLEVNGYELSATEDEQFELILAAAASRMDLGEVESWIQSHINLSHTSFDPDRPHEPHP